MPSNTLQSLEPPQVNICPPSPTPENTLGETKGDKDNNNIDLSDDGELNKDTCSRYIIFNQGEAY